MSPYRGRSILTGRTKQTAAIPLAEPLYTIVCNYSATLSNGEQAVRVKDPPPPPPLLLPPSHVTKHVTRTAADDRTLEQIL